MQHLGIRGNLLGWIDSFLSDRTFRVKVGDGLSRSVDVVSGVPQGSVLGPLLFVAYTADIKNIVTSPFAMFADDIKLYSSSANYRDLERDLRAIYDWTHDWLLPLNLDKCKVLHLGNNNPKHVYFVDNLLLSCTDSHVDLGVVVTSNLS